MQAQLLAVPPCAKWSPRGPIRTQGFWPRTAKTADAREDLQSPLLESCPFPPVHFKQSSMYLPHPVYVNRFVTISAILWGARLFFLSFNVLFAVLQYNTIFHPCLPF